MDQLVRLRSTGQPCEFANKLFISERTLYNYLSILKEIGANIHYNKNCQSYEYLDNCVLCIEIKYSCIKL